MYNFFEQFMRWFFYFMRMFLSSQMLHKRAFLLWWGQTISLTVYCSVYFLCFLLTPIVVFTVLRIQKMPVKHCELGYNILVTVSDVPVHYKIKTFCF